MTDVRSSRIRLRDAEVGDTVSFDHLNMDVFVVLKHVAPNEFEGRVFMFGLSRHRPYTECVWSVPYAMMDEYCTLI